MSDDNAAQSQLAPAARALADSAAEIRQSRGHDRLCVRHWLIALLQKYGPMAEGMTSGLDARSVRADLDDKLRQGELGEAMESERAIALALEHAKARGKTQATERDLAAVILSAAGYEVQEEWSPPTSQPRATAADSPEPVAAPAEPAAAVTSGYQPRAKRPTPNLEKYGRDVTREALEGKLSALVGRDEELEVVIVTLCRSIKRNPALVGPAGVGKTAIVEGLAQRIVRGEVPKRLQGARVFALQPSTLVAGANVFGELQERVEHVLEEASQDGIILFIDELHSMIGTGGMMGTGDVASLVKPALARGDIACIGATTDEEYLRLIDPDKALERRFQPVRVHELTPEQSLTVLGSLRDRFIREKNIQVPDDVLNWLVDFAQQHLRNRFFPDKAVDLLDQCVAHAEAHGQAEVDQEQAELVARKMVGVPPDVGSCVGTLEQQLSNCALLCQEDITSIANRLSVTMRGLDTRPARPNAVLLLTGTAAESSEHLAHLIAGALFGAEERIVSIDFSRMTDARDITLLLGAPPMYVGHDEPIELHKVWQMPWCVLRCENIQACHEQIRATLAQGLRDGFLTDGKGRRIYLSDCLVLLVARVPSDSLRTVGFVTTSEQTADSFAQRVEDELGKELAEQIDFICVGALGSDEAQRRIFYEQLLSDWSARCDAQGLTVRCDPTVITWMLAQSHIESNQSRWERYLDDQIGPLLIPYLEAADRKEVKSLVIRCEGERLKVEEEAADVDDKGGN